MKMRRISWGFEVESNVIYTNVTGHKFLVLNKQQATRLLGQAFIMHGPRDSFSQNNYEHILETSWDIFFLRLYFEWSKNAYDAWFFIFF